jgi:hypothetical protein
MPIPRCTKSDILPWACIFAEHHARLDCDMEHPRYQFGSRLQGLPLLRSPVSLALFWQQDECFVLDTYTRTVGRCKRNSEESQRAHSNSHVFSLGHCCSISKEYDRRHGLVWLAAFTKEKIHCNATHFEKSCTPLSLGLEPADLLKSGLQPNRANEREQ